MKTDKSNNGEVVLTGGELHRIKGRAYKKWGGSGLAVFCLSEIKKMIDFHTHILPALDDGSRDVKESEGLLREEVRQGVKQIVATPHFYADRVSVEEFLRRREKSIEDLYTHLAQLVEQGEAIAPREGLQTARAGMANLPGADELSASAGAAPGPNAFEIPKLRFGAEVYYFPGMGHAEKLSKLCVEGTNLILLEMPFAPWTDTVFREVKDILEKQKLRIVLAHVERYPDLQKDKRQYEQVLNLPLTIQLNGGSFLKSRSRRKFCLNMLSSKENVILGSDTHNLSSRTPNLEEARHIIMKKLGEERLQTIDRLTERILEP